MSAESAASQSSARTRITSVPRFVAAKRKNRKLAMLTAYDFLWASLLDAAEIDAILVGDSLGMVIQGKETTLPVTLDEIIYHAEMVCRAVKQALVVVDMPFMSYQLGVEQAVANAGRIIKETGAAAVKLEGGVNQAQTIQALSDIDIPVMAHIGMKPQSVRKLGGFGRVQRDEHQLMQDAQAAQDAGAFGIVLELIPCEIARTVTTALDIPTIGIGAGPHCDGQVLVGPDMLGLSDGFHPKFLKQFANLREDALQAVRQYCQEVQTGSFPDEAHSHSS